MFFVCATYSRIFVNSSSGCHRVEATATSYLPAAGSHSIFFFSPRVSLDGLPPPTVHSCSLPPSPGRHVRLPLRFHPSHPPPISHSHLSSPTTRSPPPPATAFPRSEPPPSASERGDQQPRSRSIRARRTFPIGLEQQQQEDEAEDAEQDRADGVSAGGGGGADRGHAGADPDRGDVAGEAQGVAGEGLRQGLGVLRQQVLLQPDHYRLLQGVPVREPLLQAQLPRRQGRRLLGLPGLHHRRRHVREPGLLHHRRVRDADEGALRLPRPRRRQDFMWIRCGHRWSVVVGALLQPRARPRPGLLRRLLHAVPLRQGRRVLRPRRHPRLLELQLRRRGRRHQAGPAEPPGVPGAERDAGVRGGNVAVDDADQEEAAVGARGLRRHLETHQERHGQQEVPGPGRHHEPPLWRVHVRQGVHRPHERHHLALPVLPRPHGFRPGAVRRQPRLRGAGPLQPRPQEGR